MKSFFADRLFAVSLIAAMAMVASEVSLWVVLFSTGCIILRWFSEGRKRVYVSKTHTGILSVGLLAFVLLQFKTLVGQDPAYTFLLGLTGLKILDFNSERDKKFLVLLGFVLLAVKSLFSVDIYWLVPTLLVFVFLWWSLFPTAFPYKQKTLGKIILLSAPLAIVLFITFPRFVLPWALNQGQLRGQIGFSEGLQPGTVAELAAQEGLVLRAQFREEKKSSELYWRGAILNVAEGLNWLPGRRETLPLQRVDKKDWDFFITLEPHQQRYAFVPDGTVSIVTEGQSFLRQRGEIFRFSRPVMLAQNYYGWIEKDFVENEKETVETLSKVYSQVPELGPKTQELVNEINALELPLQEKLAKVQDFFVTQGFVYTLQPGKYEGAKALEEFLFGRRRGFCEHFAGSYGVIVRALGVPSRVVVGYQGGTYNEFGNFWSVSQKFAHAWVEIFLDGRWQSVDPTRWVAPLRFEIGAEDFFALSLEDQMSFAKDLSWRPQRGVGVEWLNQVSVFLENINYKWTSFLIEFDLGSQREILRELSLAKFFNSLAFIITIFTVAILMAIFVIVRRLRALSILSLLQEFEWHLKKRNITRKPGEAPVTFLNRVKEQESHLSDFCSRFQVAFEEEIYQESKKLTLKELRDLRKIMHSLF